MRAASRGARVELLPFINRLPYFNFILDVQGPAKSPSGQGWLALGELPRGRERAMFNLSKKSERWGACS